MTTYYATGSSGSPNVATSIKTTPTNATAYWAWNTDGTVDHRTTTGISQFRAGIEWHGSPSADVWIRFTSNSGVVPSGVAMNTWLKVYGTSSANRTATWTYTSDTPGNTTGSVKVELSTDSGGSTIVATGYYGGVAQVNSGL